MKPPFNLSHSPRIGMADPLTGGLSVVTAPNASPMTFTGTNTYLLGDSEVAIIDPGPDDPTHLAALENALRGRKVSHVFVTHSHIDHSPLARIIAQRHDAPVLAYGPGHAGRSATMETLAKQGNLGGGEGIDTDFQPDITLSDGAVITGNGWALEAIHTPGHLSNHLCFAWQGQGALFSGDHVMGWSTTLVSPPDGDLTQFMASLKKLQNRPEDIYYAGHGAPLEQAQEMLAYQLGHRLGREDQIIAALDSGQDRIAAITAQIYAGLDSRLLPMAKRNVFSHLIDLYARNLVGVAPEIGLEARYWFKR